MPVWLLSTSSLLVFAAPLALPHALALFLTALATDRFLLLLEKPTRQRWIAYGIILVISIYTFYLSIAVMAAHLVVFALAWRREPRRVLSHGGDVPVDRHAHVLGDCGRLPR